MIIVFILLLVLGAKAQFIQRNLQIDNLGMDEARYRQFIIQKNIKSIKENNAKSDGVKFAPNQFVGLTTQEFSQKMGYPIQLPQQPVKKAMKHSYPTVGASIPLAANITIDWMKSGKVTSVKYQGQCNSCYAFASISDIQTSYLISKNKNYDLSEQQVIDCSNKYGNKGCNGGFYRFALNYARYFGLGLQKDYSFNGVAGACKTNLPVTYKISSFKGVDRNDCANLVQIIKNRPVLASVDAVNSYWQFYSSGILANCTQSFTLNHAVNVIGYFSYTNGTSYYLIKNSWGTGWGQNGLIRLSATVNKGNLCGICSFIYYSTI